MMRQCTNIMISPRTTIEETIRVIDTDSLQIALVVDSEYRLLGTVTDGDIRRAILRSIDLHQPVDTVMNPNPTAVKKDTPSKTIFAMMGLMRIHRIPVINDETRVIGIEVLEDFIHPEKRNNPVVIMAGGLGSRLSPLTDNCPKPLLPVGSKPILETILESLIAHSFQNFFFAVNYKADMIKDYFGTGDKWGVNIQYLQEHKKLGTAGALSLLPCSLEEPVIVINGDLLTRVDFEKLLEFHMASQCMATMCIRENILSIPYGVVKISENHLVSIDEKPKQRFFINAGIYVIEPQVLSVIPSDTYLDMTTLFEQLTAKSSPIAVFPIREYWLDIGQIKDYEQASLDYNEVFP